MSPAPLRTTPLAAEVRAASASLSADTRILVPSASLKESGIPTGAHVLVQRGDTTLAAGTAWPDFEARAGTVSLPSLLASRVQPGEKVCVASLKDGRAATEVHVAVAGDLAPLQLTLLQSVLLHTLVCVDAELALTFLGSAVSARVERADGAGAAPVVVVTRETNVRVRAAAAPAAAPLVDESAYEALGGLDAQIAAIRALIELPLTQPQLFAQYGLKPPRGVLLYGPPGTGKTSLARTVAASLQAHVLTINGPELSSQFHGETESKLRAVFDAAAAHERAIVIMDEIDALAPRRDSAAASGTEGAGEVERRVVATLLTLLDGLTATNVMVIAATNRPNALDPALRRPGRLDREIEIGVPDAAARASILRVLLQNVPHALSDDDVALCAARTHGYVGADLAALVREAGMAAIARRASVPLHQSLAALSLDGGASDKVGMPDVTAALAVVRPSAMREVFVETPKVTWADVAGEDDAALSIKRQVQECVEWPLQHAATFRRLGLDPPRGALLYGPPGCSKTLTAKALARESGLNFLAVRGPELVSKYVGESERAIREVFRRARQAAPSIIFFDELDAISGVRGTEGHHATDRMVASLLTEMDGIDTDSHVVVVAATNRPECIDPAILRPGRIDRLIYVGPPSTSVRERILHMRTKRMALAPDVELAAVAERAHGCSGAEVVAICQEAGLRAMSEDVECEHIAQRHLLAAADAMQRRITPAMLTHYEAWRRSLAL